MKTFIIFLILLFLSVGNALASVNLFNLSYHKKIKIDFLELNYSSKSLLNGFFGYGWCSFLDKELFVDKERVVLFECGERNEFKKLINKNIYVSLKNNEDTIFLQNSKWIRTHKDKKQIFDREGSLLESNLNRNTFKIFWVDKSLIHIHDKKNRVYKLKVNGKKISELQIKNKKFTFTYSNLNLMNILEQNKSLYRFQYDALNNLTLWLDSSAQSEEVNYDSSLDQVTKKRSSTGCTTYFKSEQSSMYFDVEGVRDCINKPRYVLRQRFFITKDSRGIAQVTHTKKISVQNKEESR